MSKNKKLNAKVVWEVQQKELKRLLGEVDQYQHTNRVQAEELSKRAGQIADLQKDLIRKAGLFEAERTALQAQKAQELNGLYEKMMAISKERDEMQRFALKITGHLIQRLDNE